MRIASILGTTLCTLLVACGHHHHWVRADTSHEASHTELNACEATVGRSAPKIEACMRDKGFEVE